MFRRLRIAVLLFVLASVAVSAWRSQARATAWEDTLRVAVFPIAGDDSAATADYIARLSEDGFDPIEAFVREQAQRYGIDLPRPIDIALGPRVMQAPPAPPPRRQPLAVIAWSLQLRWWAWRHQPALSPAPQVRLFVVYRDPARTPAVPHSTGLEKGLIGIVHTFASRAQQSQNAFVMAHELMHTLGATDKYDLATNLPIHPDGYAEPYREPRHPQQLAELMGGRIARTPDQADTPAGLSEAVIGPATAREIGWRTD